MARTTAREVIGSQATAAQARRQDADLRPPTSFARTCDQRQQLGGGHYGELTFTARTHQLARVELRQAAELQRCKVDALRYVGDGAMTAVASVTLRADLLAQAVPAAEGRLLAAADQIAISILGVIADTERTVTW